MTVETQGYHKVLDADNPDGVRYSERRKGSHQRSRQSPESLAYNAFRHSAAWRLSPSITGDKADVFAEETLFEGLVFRDETGSRRRSTKRGRRDVA